MTRIIIILIIILFCWCPQIEHLYGLTVFENYLYATNSDEGNLNPKTSVIRVNRFNSSDFQVVTRVDRGAALHVYHQRRQPQGISSPPPTPPFYHLFRVADAGASSLRVSAQPRLRHGSVREGRRLLRHLPAQQQPQDPDLPLPLRLQPRQRRQVLQE